MLPNRDPRLPNAILNSPDNFLTKLADLELRLEQLESAQTPPIEEIIGGRLTIADLILSPAEGVLIADPTSTDYTGSFMAGEGILFDSVYYVLGNVVNGELKTGFTDAGTLYAIDAEISGTVVIGSGSAGGWEINSTQIFSLSPADVGIILDSSVPIIRVGDTVFNHIVIDGANERIRSSNFVTGTAGFNISAATGDAEFNNIVARGELKTFLFTSQNQMAVAGNIVVTKDAGKLGGVVAAVDTTVDFGKAMTPGEWIKIQGPDAAGSSASEWMLVGSLVGGTTYNVTRDVDGSGANDWLTDTPFVVIGSETDSRIEITAGATASVRLLTQGPTWDVGYVQVELSTVEGAVTAGRGAVLLNENGITLPDAGDSLTLLTNNFGTGTTARTHFSQVSNTTTITAYVLSSTITRISNGNFATGDFTNWTETDPLGKLSVEYIEGQYAAKYNAASTTTHYIEQNLSSTATYGCVVSFKAKSDSGATCVVTAGGSNLGVNLFAEWRDFYIKFYGSTSSIRIAIGNVGISYITDIVVEPMAQLTYGDMRIDASTSIDNGLIVNTQQASHFASYFKVLGPSSTAVIFAYTPTNSVAVGYGASTAPNHKLDVNGEIHSFTSFLTTEQGSDPSTPATGKWALYSKSDGYYVMDDTGAVTGPLGTGGGGSSAGWNTAAETWTRTGNHTFTVSGDVTVTYRKGTKVRYKDGGAYEYGAIISSSHAAGTTTVQLCPNSDFAMAAATITDTYLSYIENPEGYPGWLNWTPTATGYSGTPTTNGLIMIQGDNAFVHVKVDGTSNATTLTVTNLPVAPNMGGGYNPTAVNGTTIDGGTLQTTPGRATITDGDTTITFRSNTAGGGWTNSGNKLAQTFIFYKI